MQERTSVYYTRMDKSTHARQTSSFTRTLKTQFLICILLLLFCLFIKFYPNDSYMKAEKSVQLILTHNTDVQAELAKLKSYFQKDESLDTLNPVSEMTAPANGEIVKGFGIQDASGSGFHYGVDIKSDESKNIIAANDGTVEEIGTNNEYASFIIVRHSEEITTLYGNVNEILPNIGDTVAKGQPIARTEDENGTFYFELRRGDTYLDPTQFIDFKEPPHD